MLFCCCRNQYIVGISIFLGLGVSRWMKANPGAIDTGVNVLDETLTVILQTAILVGGVCAAFLDNTIPGETINLFWYVGLTAFSRSRKHCRHCYALTVGYSRFPRPPSSRRFRQAQARNVGACSLLLTAQRRLLER